MHRHGLRGFGELDIYVVLVLDTDTKYSIPLCFMPAFHPLTVLKAGTKSPGFKLIPE
jgi:hypothetical protein